MSKDGNEIVNCIVSTMKSIHIVESDSEDEEHMDYVDHKTPYFPTINSGFYHFQVFGVDSKGKLHPHSLLLLHILNFVFDKYSISHWNIFTSRYP